MRLVAVGHAFQSPKGTSPPVHLASVGTPVPFLFLVRNLFPRASLYVTQWPCPGPGHLRGGAWNTPMRVATSDLVRGGRGASFGDCAVVLSLEEKCFSLLQDKYSVYHGPWLFFSYLGTSRQGGSEWKRLGLEREGHSRVLVFFLQGRRDFILNLREGAVVRRTIWSQDHVFADHYRTPVTCGTHTGVCFL